MPSFISILVSAGLAAASALPPLGAERFFLRDVLEARHADSSSCPIDSPAPVVTAPKPNVWAQITPADNVAVWDLLHDPATGLNLTVPSNATLSDNYVHWIDTLHTNKSDVLPYIDGSGPLPPKYARAVIFLGGLEEPISQVNQQLPNNYAT